jgi:hypothetical protein
MSQDQPAAKREILGVSANLFALLGVTFFAKETIDDAIKDLGLPDELNFYQLAFWAIAASLVGGLLWGLVNGLNVKWRFINGAPLGGSGNEPHKLSAVLWSMVTIFPLLSTLILLNVHYSFVDFGQQLATYAAFYAGCALGSWCFYDFPISGTIGIRDYLEKRRQSSRGVTEVWLGFLWPLLVAVPAFGLLWLTRIVLDPSKVGFWSSLVTFLAQVGTVVILTGLSVVAFLLTLPLNSRFDSARGIIAGLFLRASLFFGLMYI